MSRLVQADGKTRVTLITTLYNCAELKSLSEHMTCRAGYNRKLHSRCQPRRNEFLVHLSALFFFFFFLSFLFLVCLILCSVKRLMFRRRARWGYRNESDVCVFLVQDLRIMLTLVRAARQPVCRAVGLRVQKFVPHVLQTVPSLIEGCRWRGDKRLVVFMSNVMERVEGRRKKNPQPTFCH